METYLEKNLIINNRELKHKGIFRADELFSTINRALEARDYEKREKKSEETVTETGRGSYLELRPLKVKTEYVTLMLKIKIHLNNITETKEVLKGEKRVFQKGDVTIYFDAWSLTDYEKRWGMRPFFYFIKQVFNKWIYQLPMESGFISEVVGDTAYVYASVKKLLKSYGPEPEKVMGEEEVRKEMEEEIKKEIEKEESEKRLEGTEESVEKEIDKGLKR